MKRFAESLALAGALVLAGMPVRAALLEDVVVSVNGEDILLSVFDKHVEAYVQAASRMRPGAFDTDAQKMALKKDILEQLVGDVLFRQEAEKKKVKVSQRELNTAVDEIKKRMFGMDEDGKAVSEADMEAAFNKQLKKDELTLAKFREDIMNNLKIKKYYDQSIVPSVERPSEDELKAYYDKVKKVAAGDKKPLEGLEPDEAEPLMALAQQFEAASAERVAARHILIGVQKDASILEKSKALNKAKDLKKQIDAGADFGELAKEHSDDPGSKVRGGMLPPFVKGMMVPEFEKAAFGLRVGEVSAPVLSDFGYHLIRLEERRAAQAVSYEDAKPQIFEFLYNLRVQAKLRDTAKKLRDGAKIKYHGVGQKISDYEPEKDDAAAKKKG